eukprot:807450_1
MKVYRMTKSSGLSRLFFVLFSIGLVAASDDPTGAVSKDEKCSNDESYNDSASNVSNDSDNHPTAADGPTHEVSKVDKRPEVDSYDESIRTDDVSANPQTKQDEPVVTVPNDDNYQNIDSSAELIPSRSTSVQPSTNPDHPPDAVSNDDECSNVETYNDSAPNVSNDYDNHQTTVDGRCISDASGTTLRGTLYTFFIGASGTILTIVINILANGALIQCILDATCMQGCFARCPWFKEFLKIIFVVA